MDFVCHELRLIIEIDGATHSTDAELSRDARREAWLAKAGYRLLRFTNDEVTHNRDGVLETIRLTVSAVDPPPYPPPQGGRDASASTSRAGAANLLSPPLRGRGGEGGPPP